MAKVQRQIGRLDGTGYMLTFAKRGDMQFCEPSFAGQWRWWLSADGEFIGDFRTKKEALNHVKGGRENA